MKYVVTGFFVVALMAGSSLAFACQTCGCQGGDSAHDHDSASVSAEKAQVAGVAVNAGNKICPIMGGPVSEDSPDKVEYQGKIYNLCCPSCKDAFLKDPVAALKKLAEAEKAAPGA